MLKHEAPFRLAFCHLDGQVQRGPLDLRRGLRLSGIDVDHQYSDVNPALAQEPGNIYFSEGSHSVYGFMA